MKEFFERMDAGQYNLEIFLTMAAFLMASMLYSLRRVRHERSFFEAQHAAQETFEKLGRDDTATQRAVMEALNAWSRWQHRPVPSFDEMGDYPSPEEWHAISLLRALPPKPQEQYVM